MFLSFMILDVDNGFSFILVTFEWKHADFSKNTTSDPTFFGKDDNFSLRIICMTSFKVCTQKVYQITGGGKFSYPQMCQRTSGAW